MVILIAQYLTSKQAQRKEASPEGMIPILTGITVSCKQSDVFIGNELYRDIPVIIPLLLSYFYPLRFV